MTAEQKIQAAINQAMQSPFIGLPDLSEAVTIGKPDEGQYERASSGLYVPKSKYDLSTYFTMAPSFVTWGMDTAGDEPVVQEESTTEIIAWRRWRLEQREDDWLLRSQSADTWWEGPGLMADKTPAPQSPHGIYGLKDEINDSESIVGTVALSGTVICGTNGYRASRAVVQRLIVPRWIGKRQPWFETRMPFELCDELATRYACPVELRCVEVSEDEDLD